MLFQVALGLWLVLSAVLPASAGFSSLYVFGDALSATADTDPDSGSPGPPSYYGYRWSNGRVWVEVLAQRQGMSFPYNNSYFDHNSAITAGDVKNFTVPADVTNDLFIVWVCNADTFDASSDVLNNPSMDYNTLLNLFINENIQSQANHLQIITNLYAKGVRTLIMPNAVDISEIPAYNTGNATAVLHAGCVDYNVRFASTINQARALCPGLQIFTPDYYTLLNNVLTNAAYYGLTNALSGGLSIDALDQLYAVNTPNLDGPGTNYIFWDTKDPTAQFHAVIADVTQQIISPVKIGKMTSFLGGGLTGSNRLDVVNLPVGLSGFVDYNSNTNLANPMWAPKTGFDSTNATQSIYVSVLNPVNSRFYRLRFPYAWSWP